MRAIQDLRRRLAAQDGLPLVWIALTVVALIPIWRARMLPLLETPAQLALVRGWHSFHDSAFHIADYYALRIRPVPYLLFYTTVNALMYAFSIEVANKLFLSAYVILFPLSVLALARAFRRSPWLALGGFALAFNQSWIYGYEAFLMGLVFMFFALAALVRWLNEGRRWQIVWLGASCLLCYFSHVQPWLLFGLCAIALLVLYHARWRNGLLAAAAMLPSVILGLVAYGGEKKAHFFFASGSSLFDLTGSWHDFPTLVLEFPKRVMELFPGNLDTLALALMVVCVVVLVAWKGTRLPDDAPEQRRQIGLLLLVLGAAYVLLPFEIKKPMSWWYVSARVPVMMAPLLLLWPAVPGVVPLPRVQRLLFAPLVAAAIIIPLQLATLYRVFSRHNVGFLHLVERLPVGSRTLVVVRGMNTERGAEELSGDPSSSSPVYWRFSSWPMVLKGGYDPYLVENGVPIVPKIKVTAPPFSEIDGFQLRKAPEFEYYIVRYADDYLEREPSLKVQERQGEWVLFKRIHPMTDEP